MRLNQRFLISVGCAALIVFGALLISSSAPLFSSLRHTLAQLPSFIFAAATPLGVSQGLPSYNGYPSPANCNTGDALCYPNLRTGVFSIISQINPDAGQTNYINLQNATSSVGTAVVLQNLDPTTVQWSCQNSQTVGTQVYAGQVACGCTGNNCCSWSSPCCCQQYCPSYTWEYATYNFATNATITDPEGAVLLNANGTLYGSQSVVLGGPAGTYAAGETVNYALNCVGSGTNPVYVPVTMGPTITTTSIAAPATARAGLDEVMLTVSFSSAVSDSCNLLRPDGSVLKAYSGSSVTNDLVQVGPFGNTDPSPATYTIRCLGPEGFNSVRSASIVIKTPPNLSITANNTPVQVTIAPSTSADIRWTSSNQAPNSCSVTYAASGGSCAAGAKTIATTGAYGMKSFTIGADTYLAVANAYDGSSYSVNSKVYKWISGQSCFGDGTDCGTAYQSIPTNGAAAWGSFTVGADTYLAVANSRDDATRNVNSKIYKWLSAQACLGAGSTCGAPVQSISTSGAVDLKPITVGADTYLAVANYRDDLSYTINSNVYRWMSGSSCFGDGITCGEVLQAIPTKGAYRMESFVLGGEYYLAVSNAFEPGPGYNQPSYIFKFTPTGANCPAGGGWGNGIYRTCGVPYQTINTSGAYGFKFFTIGNASYLAVANSYNGASFNINSKIYRWMTSGAGCPAGGGFGDGTTCGAAFQAVPTNGATSVNTFVVGPTTYLLAANAYSGSTYNVNSNIYQWMEGSQCFGNGAACGEVFQAVPTSGAAWWEPMTIGGVVYLGVANYFNGTTYSINSSVMQWLPSGCGTGDSETPTVWTGDQSPSPNGYQTGVFSGLRTYTLSCNWLDGTTASSTSVNVVVLPQLVLSANGSSTSPVYITPNTSALVQWSTIGIQQNSCSVTNTADSSVWAADNNTAGYPTPVLADQQQVTYTLACTDLQGAPQSKVLTVIGAIPVPQTADMTISASRVLKGTRPTIQWSAQNLREGISCGITPLLQGGSSISNWDGSGTSWSSPFGGALGPVITAATAFTLTCTNEAGDASSVSATASLLPAFKEL